MMTVSPVNYCNIMLYHQLHAAISIGFELPSFTYNEPLFEEIIDQFFVSPNGLIEYGPVYLIKENNVTTEQIFDIAIQISDAVPAGTNPATFNEDYTVGAGDSFSRTFFPNMQRLDIEFVLLPDNIPEGNEAFLFSSSRQDTASSGGMEFTLGDYLSPMFASAFVNILDDDREFQCINHCSSMTLMCPAAIIIGFENTAFSVHESDGMFDVYVCVTSPPMGVQLFTSVDLVIQTIAGNASKDNDYFIVSITLMFFFLSWRFRSRRS